MPDTTINRCRALLESLTPLHTDCGQLCAGACCRSQQGEETGMLLFAGEAEVYRGMPGVTLRDTAMGPMLVCSGTCDRTQRPLSCRIFPLLPVVRNGQIKIAMDARAKAVCPLCSQGVSGLSQQFVEAVRTCGQLLYEDEAQRPMLERLTREHDELKALQRAFGGR